MNHFLDFNQTLSLNLLNNANVCDELGLEYCTKVFSPCKTYFRPMPGGGSRNLFICIKVGVGFAGFISFF